jgi:hypothetical protein
MINKPHKRFEAKASHVAIIAQSLLACGSPGVNGAKQTSCIGKAWRTLTYTFTKSRILNTTLSVDLFVNYVKSTSDSRH